MWRLVRIGWSKTRCRANFGYAAEIYFVGGRINGVESFWCLHNPSQCVRSFIDVYVAWSVITVMRKGRGS